MATKYNSTATTQPTTVGGDAVLRFYSQLEVVPLLEEFSAWVQNLVNFSQLHYRHPALGLFEVINCSGTEQACACSSHPLLDLGGLHFLRDHAFSADEEAQLAQCVDTLRQPLQNASLYHSVVRHCDGLTHRLGQVHTSLNPEAPLSDSELHDALLRDAFSVLYQPKVELKSGKVTGLEALLRWYHPERGALPPELFIPFAERNGLIQLLTRWVLNTVLRQGALWRQQGILLPIAVNLSGHDLEDATLPDYLEQLLQVWELPAQFLELEITETAAIGDQERAVETLQRLSSLGVTVAIDDFGIGYSSLQRLKQLPIDAIKIDKSFVMEQGRDKHDGLFVDTIIRLGHQLGMKVVAEGVDSPESWLRLLGSGCDMAQGYHISHPLPGETISGWLQERACLGLTLQFQA